MMLSKTAFIFYLALVIAISVLYLYNIIKWAAYPDFGFGFRSATGIDVVGMVSEQGRKAGIELGDRFLKVNGKTFSNIEKFRAAMNREVGEKNTYLIERNGQRLEITIPVVAKGLKRSFSESGFLYLLGLCYILIGTLVFLMKSHRRTSWIFFIFATTFGLFLAYLRRAGTMAPFWLETVSIIIYCFTPAVFIHLAISFPEERRLLRKLPHVQFLPYTAAIILFVCIRYATPTILDTPKTLYIATVGYMLLGVLVFVGSCLQLWLASRSEIVKLRAKMILLGFAISASVPLLDYVSNAVLGVYVLPSYNYYLPFFIVFPVFVGYSIIKHDLFDFDAIIKRTYGYVLTTGTIAGMYGLFVFVSNLAFGSFEIAKSPAFPLVFVLAVVFLFNPVRNRLQKFIDRVFYRLEYDYQETVQKISETMRSLLNLDQIGKAMMDTALGAMFIDSGSVILLNKERAAYECLLSAGERERRVPRPAGETAPPTGKEIEKGDILLEDQASEPSKGVAAAATEEIDPGILTLKLPVDEPLIQKMAERKREVTIYDIQEDPFFEDEREGCQEAFDKMEATLIVPLVYEDRLTGLMSLGQKKSGKFYRREDINLLNTLANQGAVAIENALMVEDVVEKERMEEELAIAHDLQTSMLPATCPEMEGFEIAATSIPAREVGGDFFDFIEMGESSLGLVIADVTGKSVSGALVMSSSRSVFRMLSEEKLSVGDIMVRANRRIKKDIKSGMFVALLYAVIEAKERNLSLSSAGQTQPIYLSAETGEASLVETVGDTFPLGILEDADYQETRLRLEPGDKVVFYTDGIVEAMNEKEEIFGFDRLLDVVRGARAMDAESLLKEIVDKVNEFAGGAAQHDDLTVIVLSVAG